MFGSGTHPLPRSRGRSPCGAVEASWSSCSTSGLSLAAGVTIRTRPEQASIAADDLAGIGHAGLHVAQGAIQQRWPAASSGAASCCAMAPPSRLECEMKRCVNAASSLAKASGRRIACQSGRCAAVSRLLRRIAGPATFRANSSAIRHVWRVSPAASRGIHAPPSSPCSCERHRAGPGGRRANRAERRGRHHDQQGPGARSASCPRRLAMAAMTCWSTSRMAS